MKTGAAGLALALLVIAPGCRRDAEAPLPSKALFPVRSAAIDAGTGGPFGAIFRAPVVDEVEPNDTPAEALVLRTDAVVRATLSASGHVPGAVDWYLLRPPVDPDKALRVELLRAPDCAEISICIPGVDKAVQTARVRHGRAVIASLNHDGRGLLVRVRCRPARRGRQPVGGSYRLAFAVYDRAPGEEREPNDRPDANAVILRLGKTLQGAISHRGDLDVVRLERSEGGDGEVLRLAVTAIPKVALRLRILAEDGEAVLTRTAGRGQGIEVANIDARLLPEGALVELGAVRGFSPDHAYAVAWHRLPVLGVALQEREPNDFRARAGHLELGEIVTGRLDPGGDIDWYALAAIPGRAISATLRVCPGFRGSLTLSGQAGPLIGASGQPGAPVRIEGYEVPAEGTVGFRVRARRDRGVDLPGRDPRPCRYRLGTTDLSALDDALALPGLATPTTASEAPSAVPPPAPRHPSPGPLANPSSLP